MSDISSRHKADMLSAAAVNKTFISPDVIKWSGFEVIGDTLLSVLHCQRHPYQFIKRDENVERAILETPDISEQVELFNANANVRIWTLNHMNTSHLQNDHIQNHSPLGRSGSPKRSLEDRKEGGLFHIMSFWIRWIAWDMS